MWPNFWWLGKGTQTWTSEDQRRFQETWRFSLSLSLAISLSLYLSLIYKENMNFKAMFLSSDGSQYDLFTQNATCKCYFFENLGKSRSDERSGGCHYNSRFSAVLHRRFMRHGRDLQCFSFLYFSPCLETLFDWSSLSLSPSITFF